MKRTSFEYNMDEIDMNIVYKGKNVPHPSSVFLELLKRANLQDEPYSKIAKSLGITRNSFYSFINCKTGISPEMSVRLARFFHDFPEIEFSNANSAQFWWMLNSKWVFYNTFNSENPNCVKNIPVGLKRYFYTKNNISDNFMEESQKIVIDDDMQVTFTEHNFIKDKNKSFSYPNEKFDFPDLLAAEEKKEYNN